MNHDRTSDSADPAEPADARLTALYQAHLAHAEQAPAASDARILALARAAVGQPAAKPGGSGWGSWLKSSRFGPGLAFATVASLTVVVVALMPKEDMSVERAMTAAPGAPSVAESDAARAASASAPAPVVSSAVPAPVAAGSAPAPRMSGSALAPVTSSPVLAPAAAGSAAVPVASGPAPAPLVTRPEPAPASLPSVESAAAPSALAEPSAKQAPKREARAKLARADEAARAPRQRGEAVAVRPAAPDVPAPQFAATPGPKKVFEPPQLSAAPAAPAGALGKAINQHIEATRPPVPQVDQPNPFPLVAGRADSATATRVPRAQPAATVAADAGALARRDKPSLLGEPADSSLTANRTESLAESRAADKPAPAAAAAPAIGTMAAAPPKRDPAEWIKAIQKLRIEGKTEQVTKELTEFRRQYPLHPLPDELKKLVK